MHILDKFLYKLWLLPALALLLTIVYLRFVMTTVPENGVPSAANLRYLPTAVNTHTPPLSPAAAVPTAVATAVITTSVAGNRVDMTEDYKALGYTDNRKLVRDEDDNLYIAYRKKWQGQYRIFVAKSTDDGKRWKVLNGNKPVESVGDYTQRVPSLAIGRNEKDDANFLHLVWYGNDSEHPGNERQIKYVRLTTAGKRSSDDCCAVAINIAGYDGQELWQEHPAIYVNGSNVYIVWEGRDPSSTNAKIKFIRSTDFGHTWTEPQDIAPSDQINFSRPTLAVAYRGKARQLYVVAYGENRGIAQIYWSRSLDNGDRWAAWQPVATTTTDQRHVSLVRDDADQLHIVWREVAADGLVTILRYRVFNPALSNGAGNWVAAAETIAAQRAHCLFFPSVAVDEKKQVWVAWTVSADCHTVPSDDPLTGQIVYRVKSAAGRWGGPVSLTGGGAHLYASLRSEHAPSGTAMDLVWLDVSECAKEQEQEEQSDATDGTATTACVIRYASLK